MLYAATMETVRVLLANPDPAVRTDVLALLERAGHAVAGEAACGQQALCLAEAMAPDVLLAEAELPGLTTAEVTRRLREGAVPVPVLVLSACTEASLVSALLEAGVAGYLTRDETPERIAAAVAGVARGEKAWFSRGVVERLAARWSEPAPKGLLSPRELDVLRLVAQGLEGKRLATALHLSPETVKVHVKHILAKLGAHTRTHALALAYSRGLLSRDDLPGGPAH